MKRMRRVLDLDGQGWPVPAGEAALRLPDGLAGPTILLTDYRASPFGVADLPAQHADLAPILEKRLRDEGDIDGLARVIIHACERQGDVARVCYTAIPVAEYLQYRQWVNRHDDHLLLFPLLEAMLGVVRRRQWDKGLLLFVHGDSVDVLAVREGQPLHAARQRLFTREAAEYARLAAQLRPLHAVLAEGTPPACLLIERTPGECQPLLEALAAQGIAVEAGALPADSLFEDLHLSRADMPPLARALYQSRQALPWVAALMFLACLVGGGAGLLWKHQAQSLQATLDASPVQRLAETQTALTEALRDASALEQSQRELTDFVRLADRVRKTPDPATLLRHLRQTVPDGIALVEAGIITDEQDGVLIVVAGRSSSVAAPFAAEEQFVKALHGLGYRVVRREIESDIGNSMFRLALTWVEE